MLNSNLYNLVSKGGKALTPRYSPGYGDLSINIQNQLLDILDAKKSIGLSATSNNILIPRKSVTAIIGIIDDKYKKLENACLNCSKYESCNFRKGDEICGG